jgi:Chaperone of endosialidase
MAADYDLGTAVEKRTRFFDGQFLQDQDFVDEQKYHLDRQRRHNRLLHVAGVAEGLAVSASEPNKVTVGAGTAIDVDGRALVLAEPLTVDLPAERFNDKQNVDLFASYSETEEDRQTEEGSEDFTRWLERPRLQPVPPGESYQGKTPPVLLARLGLDGAGRVTVDESVRGYSGVRLPGKAADPPLLRTTPAGPVALTAPLNVGGRLDVRADATTVGGWYEAVRLSRAEHSAITHPGGGLLFGLHGDRNFYFGDVSGTQPKYVMIVEGDTGNVGVGTAPSDRLHVKGGKLRLDTNQQVVFDDGDLTNNLKLQLWTGYGLGINGGTLFYAANGRHSWRDNAGANERMALTTGADGALTVGGTGTSTFAGPLQLRRATVAKGSGAWNFLELYQDESTPASMSDVYPTIRFRHHQHFETTLETRPGAFHMLANQAKDTYADLSAGKLSARGLSIGTYAGTPKVGTDASRALVDIQAADRTGTHPASVPALYVTANLGEASAGIEFRHSNATQGLGFGYSSIYAAGTNADQHVNLIPKGKGGVGIGTTNPLNDLEVGNYEARNRYLAIKVAGGSAWRSGIKLWTWKENYGYSIEYDERPNTNGLHIKTHNANVDGNTQLFVHWNGNVGVGTITPEQRLTVNGDLRFEGVSTISGGGRLHISGDEILYLLNKSGVTIGKEWGGTGNLTVQGNVGVGLADTGGHKLRVQGGTTWLEGTLWVGGPLVYWWGPDGRWKNVQNRADNWAGSYDAGGPSDLRLKTAVRPIEGALDTVRRLHGKRFRWGDDGVEHLTRDLAGQVTAGPDATEDEQRDLLAAERERVVEGLSRDYLGLIAQDVEAVLPELVHDEDGYKHIRYQQLTALLIEAVKEQDAVVRALSARIGPTTTNEQGA